MVQNMHWLEDLCIGALTEMQGNLAKLLQHRSCLQACLGMKQLSQSVSLNMCTSLPGKLAVDPLTAYVHFAAMLNLRISVCNLIVICAVNAGTF